ncbi:hypothetical protein MMC30_009101 [Trapelia coarctata]|nr:hypothetical protein [Trapelia coarctata]
MAQLHLLPPEIVREVLEYLPIPSLFAFGQTSRTNHALASTAFVHLRLGIFPSRINGMISMLEGGESQPNTHSVQIVLPKRDGRSKEMVIRKQNMIISSIITRHGQTLRDLELALWDLNQSAAESIGQLPNLRHLSIRLDHPHTRFLGLDRSFWKTAPASTVWNALSAPRTTSKKSLAMERPPQGLRRLQSLTLERAGITDYQIQCILEDNPKITELRLQKCIGLTEDFFHQLVRSRVGHGLRIFHFTHNESEWIDERVLEYIGQLPNLQEISFYKCHNIDSEVMRKLNDEAWHLGEVVYPQSPESPAQEPEVDPLYNMAEIQHWRRRIQHRRSHPSVKGQDQDLDKAEITTSASILSNQALSEADGRSRPMSRLASFLTVHSVPGSIDKPEPPAFDWALPKDKDKVYKPDIEAMCNTLRSRVLRYPVDDIPAQYNSFVLHLLEEYQQLLDEKNSLQKALDAEIEDHEAEASKFRSMNAAWEVERKRLGSQAPSKWKQESNNGLGEAFGESIPFRMLRSKDKTWPLSPSRGMTRLSRQFLKKNLNADQPATLLLPRGDQPQKTLGFLDPITRVPNQQPQDLVPSSGSDFSDVKGDLLPDEEEEEESSIFEKEDQAHIARLANWLAEQNLADSQIVIPELSSSVPDRRGVDNWLSLAGANGGIATVRKLARVPALNLQGRPPLARNHKSDEEVTARKNADTHQHRRGFSFVPGDDSKNPAPRPFRTTSVLTNVIKVDQGTPTTLAGHPLSNLQECSSISGQARPVSTPLRSLAGEPQRDNSNRSVLTAIHNGSESPSPGPIHASNDGSRKRMRPARQASSDKKLSLATAAARAAGKT